MIPDGQSLTSAVLDGKSVIEMWQGHVNLSTVPLTASSKFEVRVESPTDLALQSLEAAHNMCCAVLRNIKLIAVNLWQAPPLSDQSELQQMSEDVEIVIDLIDHSKDLGVDTYVDFGPMIDLQAHLKKVILNLSAAFARSDWRACAQILLRDTNTSTGLESTLKSLQEEFESAHLRVLTSRAPALIAQL
jgi:hypothetical protein